MQITVNRASDSHDMLVVKKTAQISQVKFPTFFALSKRPKFFIVCSQSPEMTVVSIFEVCDRRERNFLMFAMDKKRTTPYYSPSLNDLR